MAKTFGQEDESDDEDSKKGACGGGRRPSNGENSCAAQQEEIREEAEEGQHLYLEFIRTEMERFGALPMLPSDLENLDPLHDGHIAPERLSNWTRAGRDLRQMADAFAKSKERDDVRRQAQKINLESLDFKSFLVLLRELFQGEGVTSERILVLFFFCADLTIEALKKGYNTMYLQIIQWSLKYISTYVAQWVHNHGGWGVVLRSSLHIAFQLSVCVACVAFAAACFVYCKRNT
jgi:hypothetical protein